MCKNVFAAGPLPQSLLGELTVLPQTDSLARFGEANRERGMKRTGEGKAEGGVEWKLGESVSK